MYQLDQENKRLFIESVSTSQRLPVREFLYLVSRRELFDYARDIYLSPFIDRLCAAILSPEPESVF